MFGSGNLHIQAVHRFGLAALAMLLLLLVLELVRRGFLKERYALLWLATSASGLVVGLFPATIIYLSCLLHFQYVTVIFVLSFFYVLGLVLCFSIVLSRLSEKNRQLAQEVALLAKRVADLERHDSS